MKCQFPATVNKVTTLVDGSLRISFETREMPAADMAALFSLNKREGFVLFAEHELAESDLESLPPVPTQKPDGDGKTPSQRLRACLYRLWEVLSNELQKQGMESPDFDSYYEHRINGFIAHVKSELDVFNGV